MHDEPPHMPPENHAPASFRSILGEKNFARLWYGQIISSLGDRFYSFALLSVVLGIKGGMEVGKETARVTFCAMLPGLLFAPLYGWIVDHFSRRWVMFWSDIVRAVMTLSLLYWWFQAHNLAAVFTVIFFMGAFNGLFIPARQAALPQIVTPDKLVPANALISLVGVIANLVGALFATLFVSIFGAPSSFVFNALGFLCSAWFIYHISSDLSPGPRTLTARGKKIGFWRSSAEGWHVLREQRELGPIVLVKSAFSLISALGLITILQQMVVTMDLGAVRALAESLKHFLTHFAPKPPVFDIKTLAFGLFFAAIGLGVGLGVGICGWARKWSHSKALPFAGLATLGATLIGFAQFHEYIPAILGAFALGIVTALILIPIEARLQNDVDDARRGRLFALCNLCTTVSFLLGLALNLDGTLLRVLGPSRLIEVIGGATMAIAFLLALTNASKLSSFWSSHPKQPPAS
jgi:MFS family permease